MDRAATSPICPSCGAGCPAAPARCHACGFALIDDETAAVRCPYTIEPRQLVRCELRYADGIPRPMLVRLTPSGELDAAIPTRRRSGVRWKVTP